jgi:glyoxylase-like metal-dependent hydrolase (beta-lactamase superfamily II)
LKLQFVYSCYLIKHGNDYMMWDTGQSMNAGAVASKIGLVDLLAQMKVTPEQVKYVGISHYHGDHIGQANGLPQATLLIGKGRLGRADQPQTADWSEPAAGFELDQRRWQGRSRSSGQGRVRRRHGGHAVHTGALRATTACWSSWRKWGR